MRLELRAKWLQHLFTQNKNQGFTLIELLVVIIIIGILGFMALPSFLSCGKKANQAEARTYVGSLNRGQQAYWVENNAFSSSIEKLELGIKTKTENYQYLISTTKKSAFSYGVSLKGTPGTKSYVGGVFLVPEMPVKQVKTKAVKQEIQMTIVAIVCAAKEPGTSRPAHPIYQNDKATCGDKTYDPLNRN